MSAWFYMLRLESGKLYPGATKDLQKRWQDHLAGSACRTTKYDPPTALAYSEEHCTFAMARRRESQIKRWSAKKKEALVAGDTDALRMLAQSHDHEGGSA